MGKNLRELCDDIQKSAISSDVNITDILRKCKVLANCLKNKELIEWVDRELNGYKSKEDLPSYRVLHVQSYGDFSGTFGSGLRNASIPPSCLEKFEGFKELATRAYLIDPISAYVSLVDAEKEEDTTLRFPWPSDLLPIIGTKIFTDMNCLSAWKLVPANSLVAFIDTVRNRILSFILEIKSDIPDSSDGEVDIVTIPEQTINQDIHTHIYGNVGNLASGSSDFSQTTEVRVKQGDLNSLMLYLSSMGVAEEDADELKNAILEDQESTMNKKIGAKTSVWLGNMIGKASSGALKISATVASGALTKAVCDCLGLG